MFCITETKNNPACPKPKMLTEIKDEHAEKPDA